MKTLKLSGECITASLPLMNYEYETKIKPNWTDEPTSKQRVISLHPRKEYQKKVWIPYDFPNE